GLGDQLSHGGLLHNRGDSRESTGYDGRNPRCHVFPLGERDPTVGIRPGQGLSLTATGGTGPSSSNLIEFHFEFHYAGRIGKRRQTEANAGEDWKTLNRCGCER